MAATERKNVWLWAKGYTSYPQEMTGKIKASQGIYMPGAPCYVGTTAGQTTRCASSAGSDAWHGFLCEGVAAELAANAEVKYSELRPLDLYAIYCETGAADTFPAQANVGTSYGATVSATAGQIGYTTLALDNASDVATVIDIASNVSDDYTAGAAATEVALVRFLNSVIQATKA